MYYIRVCAQSGKVRSAHPTNLCALRTLRFGCEFLGDRNFGRQINVLNGVEQFYTFFKGTLKSFAAGN